MTGKYEGMKTGRRQEEIFDRIHEINKTWVAVVPTHHLIDNGLSEVEQLGMHFAASI